MLFDKAMPGSEAEDLMVMSLVELVQRVLQMKGAACLIVTTLNHSTCFLADSHGLKLFDPLPASLTTVPRDNLEAALARHYGPQNASALYSAVLLQRKGVYEHR